MPDKNPRPPKKPLATKKNDDGNPFAVGPDICKHCGDRLGYGIKLFHLNDCGDHATKRKPNA